MNQTHTPRAALPPGVLTQLREIEQLLPLSDAQLDACIEVLDHIVSHARAGIASIERASSTGRSNQRLET